MKKIITLMMLIVMAGIFATPLFAEGTVRIGFNYPKTGPYHAEGLDQYRAAAMAIEEINAAGGIGGNQIELVWRDSKSDVEQTRVNVTDLITDENVSMVFGGSSSAVAIASGDICQQYGVPFFGTQTYWTEMTCENGHRFTFRECYDSRMAANAIGEYLTANFPGQNYMYVTSDYAWGWNTEEALRKITNTEDKDIYKGVLVPQGTTDFNQQLSLVKVVKPDVLVLVLFGEDMVNAVRQAEAMGLKNRTQIVVPNLTLGMVDEGGPKVMEGVVGALPWCWQVPYQYDYPRGKKFVEDYSERYNRYPSTSGASAYTIIYQYKDAVERAASFEGTKVVQELEGHEYQLLKDMQVWRDFDHQSIQTVYTVKCKTQEQVLADQYHLDYFEIVSELDGQTAACSREAWMQARQAADMPPELEPLVSAK